MSRNERRKRRIHRFGEKLHSLRTTRGLTLTELAQALGYKAHGYISELEAGKKLPTVEFVVALSLHFDISADLLLRDDIDLPETTQEDK
jgi:transcriptional regulator with XRE-family HTH domain